MDKRSAIKIAIDAVILCAALSIAVIFRDELIQQPASTEQLYSTNWFISIPFFLGLIALIIMGYITERRTDK